MGEEMGQRRISESQRRAYLDALGVECWVRQENPPGDIIESIATLEQHEPQALNSVPAPVADSAMPADLNPQTLIAALQKPGQADKPRLMGGPLPIRARDAAQTQPETWGPDQLRDTTHASDLPHPTARGMGPTVPTARGVDQTHPATRGTGQPPPAARGNRQLFTPAADPAANTANRSTPPARESNLSDATTHVMSADETQAWEILRAEVAPCTRCELHKQRTQTVFGVGNEQAEWLVIGEAPGADEDRQGEPFVGKAGQLLNAMLFAIGFNRGDVYITNVVKCRPPQNRDPQPQETAACADYLRRQIALIRPRIILALGRVAAQNLLNTETPIGKLRQVTHRYADTSIPLVATYHPAYLLRSPLEKRKAWQDLLFAREVLARTKGMD